MTKLKIIQGRRRELEYQLLAAMFTPGGNVAAELLKQNLAPRGKDRLRAVGASASASRSDPSAPQPKKGNE